MPHEVGIIAAKQFCNEENNTEWKLILDWCLLAAQAGEKGTSWLGLQVKAVTEGDDDYFAKWIEQRLEATFGPRPKNTNWGRGHGQEL
jgi:hypothetical protein